MKLTLTAIASRYGSVDALNDNFDLIVEALENTLSRDGSDPNEMEADLDMNGQAILNASAIYIGGVALEQTTLVGSAVYNPADLADGQGVTTTIAVVGAALGDFAMASFSDPLVGVLLTAWVSATDVVSIRFQNESGTSANLAEGTLRVRVIPV